MRIAVVDDQKTDSTRIEYYLEQYQQKKDETFRIDIWNNSLEFMNDYKNQYDVIFLDIEMPGLNGMEVAKELRKKDEHVGIIFITNMAQYAIRGYEVNAIDFLVKPVSYYNFADKMDKAKAFVRQKEGKTLLLSDENGIVRVGVSDVWYIEKNKNYLIFHTGKGNFKMRGTVQEMKEKLEGLPFAACSSGCLVNMAHVDKVVKDTVWVKEDSLPLSRRMKKTFIQSVMDYLGGTFL